MGKSIISWVGVVGMSLSIATITLSSSAFAQYKWQGADGKINYSDIPPPAEGKLISGPNGAPPIAAPTEGELPYALKQAVAKYPVSLFSAPDCAPCKMARELLTKRGVPFNERTLSTSSDIEQFKKLGFADATLPSVTVGKEKSVGFEASAYDRLLDAAGYPRSSLLPKSFKQANAESLTKSSATIKMVEVDGAKLEGAKEGKAEPTKRQLDQSRRQEEIKKQTANPTNVQF